MAGESGGRATIQEPCVLLVEGPDDRGFFEALFARLSISTPIQIINLEGRKNLRARLEAVVTLSRTGKVKLRSIGIALDCEESPTATAQMIQNAFDAMGLGVPANASFSGGANPQTAYMLFPDDHTSGMLEDLCIRAFVHDPAFTCVDEYFNCLDQQNSLFCRADISKARVRAYLASKDKAETRLGIAAQKSWWPWDDPAFDEAKRFLKLIAAI